MAKLNYKGYTGSVEVSIDDGCLYGRIQFINDDIIYESQTVDGLESAFKEAVDLYLEHCNKVGRPANKPFRGSFNVRVGQELHRKAAEKAFQLGVNLNEFVTKAIENALQPEHTIKLEHSHKHTFQMGYNNPFESIVMSNQANTWSLSSDETRSYS